MRTRPGITPVWQLSGVGTSNLGGGREVARGANFTNATL